MGGDTLHVYKRQQAFSTVFVLVLLIESALLWPTVGCVVRSDKVQKTLLNERTFLAGFFVLVFFFFFTYEKMNQGWGGQTQKNPGAINQSLQPMLCNSSIWRQSYNIGGHECSKTKRH